MQNLNHVCPVCKKPQHVHVCLRTEMAECKNVDCDLFEVTLEVGQHEQLTPDEIAGWKATNARLSVRGKG